MYKAVCLFLLLGVFTSFAQVNLDSGLVAWYPFNGNANDESGNGNNGTINGAILTTDRFGSENAAYYFDGISNTIFIGDNDILNPHTGNMTIALWIKQAENRHQRAFSKGTWGGAQPGYTIMQYPINPEAKPACILGVDGHEHIIIANEVEAINVWHFMCGVINRAGYLVLWVDGIKQSDSSYIGDHFNIDISSGTGDAGIGYSPSGLPEYFIGCIDDITIFNRILTDDEILTLINETPLYEAPVLLIPQNNSTNNFLIPNLQWQAVPNASSYTLQVSTNEEFSNLVVNQSNIANANFHLNNLSYNTSYYWRVKAKNGLLTSVWSEIWSFTTMQEPDYLSINLISGWNLISSNVLPLEPVMDSIFNNTENLVIVKNNAGQVYSPSFGINQIGNWDISQGYYVYVTSSSILQIEGILVNPLETPINLNQGWNLVSYLRNSEMLAPDALQGISASMLFAKDKMGNIYHPGYGINTIGNMQPGQGYWIYMNAPAFLTYPGN